MKLRWNVEMLQTTVLPCSIPLTLITVTVELGSWSTQSFNLSQFIIYSPSHGRAVLKNTCKSLLQNLDFTHATMLHGKVSCQRWFKETSSSTNSHKPDSAVEEGRFLESRYSAGGQAILFLYKAPDFDSGSFSSVNMMRYNIN